MGSVLDRIRGQREDDDRGLGQHSHQDQGRDGIEEEPQEEYDIRNGPGIHRCSTPRRRLIGTMPLTQTNWGTFLRGLFTLLLSAMDTDTTPGEPHDRDQEDLRITRYSLMPRYAQLSAVRGDLPPPESTQSIWMNDEWFRLLARALVNRQEDLWTVSQGRTQCGLLHLAARMNFPLTTYEIVQGNRELIDIRDDNHNTPLMEAASYGSFEALLVLIRCGARTDLRNHREETALHLCASKPECSERKREKCLALILEHERETLNGRDVDGNTPLHRAAGTHRVSERMLVILVHSGADASLKNNSGMTPLHYYLSGLSQWTRVIATIIPPMHASFRIHTRIGMKTMFAMTPKFQSMVTDSEGNYPSVLDLADFAGIREAFFRRDPQSLEEMALHVVRQSVGLDNITDRTRAWREVRLPRHLRRMVREHKLKEVFARTDVANQTR